MPKENVRLPRWQVHLPGLLAIVFIAFFVMVVALPYDLRSRFEAAGQAVAGLAVPIAVVGMYLAFKQFALQRSSIGMQYHSFEYERIAAIGDEYSAWLGAAAEVANSLRARGHSTREQQEIARLRMKKLSVKIGLKDNDFFRARIRDGMATILSLEESPINQALVVATTATDFRNLAINLAPKSLWETNQPLTFDPRLEKLLGAKTLLDVASVTWEELYRMQDATLEFALLAIRSTMAADEVAAGLMAPRNAPVTNVLSPKPATEHARAPHH